MKSYYEEMQNIYSRLEELENMINPSRNPFVTDDTHPLQGRGTNCVRSIGNCGGMTTVLHKERIR